MKLHDFQPAYPGVRLKLTWDKEISNPIISLGERVEYPPTPGVEPSVAQIVVVLQASKAVGPQTHFLNLGPVEPRITLDPVRRHKSGCDEDNAEDSDGESSMAGERPLPVDIGVREEVVSQPHGDLEDCVPDQDSAHISAPRSKMAEDRCNLCTRQEGCVPTGSTVQN